MARGANVRNGAWAGRKTSELGRRPGLRTSLTCLPKGELTLRLYFRTSRTTTFAESERLSRRRTLSLAKLTGAG